MDYLRIIIYQSNMGIGLHPPGGPAALQEVTTVAASIPQPAARPPRRALRYIGLQRRIMAYVTLGCIGLLLLLAYVAERAVHATVDIILHDRTYVAELTAAQVDQLLYADTLPQEPADVHGLLVRLGQMHEPHLSPFSLTMLSPEGEVLSSSAPMEHFVQEEHRNVLANLVKQTTSGWAEHKPVDGTVHLVVYAPLPSGRGGIALEQPEGMALRGPRLLRRQLTIIGAATVFTALALAWLTTRQVVRPLEVLTAHSRRIAAGNLELPVPVDGQDEIALLSSSFETMRRQLRSSRTDLEAANRDLEQRVQQRTRELEQINQALREQERQRAELLKKLIQAQEEERRRVARELHDHVGQFLTAMIMRLGSAEAIAAGGECPPGLRTGLEELQGLASRTVDDVRRIIVDLRPSVLDDMGLVPALSWYAEVFLQPAGIAVDQAADGLHDRLPAHVEVAVFRIVQEAFTNIIKHARASAVTLRLTRADGTLTGMVRDNGAGFDASAALGGRRGRASVGLLGMRERATLLGGTLAITSAPGAGTEVRFSIPLTER